MVRIRKTHIIFAILVIMFLFSIYLRVFGFFTNNFQYLRNIDSFMFLRRTIDIVQTGGTPSVDYLMQAPVGKAVTFGPVLYSYIAAYSYMFINVVAPVQVWQWLIWFPVILASLVIFPMYFIGKALYSRKAGLFAGFFVTFSAANVARSLGGDPDTDAIVILIPIICMAFFFLSYKALEKGCLFTKKSLLFAALTGISLAIFANIWPGYWYVLWIITGFVILYLILDTGLSYFLHKVQPKEIATKHKAMLLNLAIIIICFVILTTITMGFNYAASAVAEPLSLSGISRSGDAALKSESGEFPNVYVSVQELMAGGELKDIITKTSNIELSGIAILISPFMLTVYVILYTLYRFIRHRDHLDTFTLLVIWFVGGIFASMVAVRFTMFLVGVISLGSAIFFARIWDYAFEKAKRK